MDDSLTFEVSPTPHFFKDQEIHLLKIFYSIPHTASFELSSIYFTLGFLKENHPKLAKPRDAELPTFPSFAKCFCISINKKERNNRLNNYFYDIRNQFLIKGRIDKLFKSLNFPLIKEPFSPLKEIREYLHDKYQLTIKINNPLNEQIRKPIIRIAGLDQVLYDHGVLPEAAGGFATVHLYGVDEDRDPEYCLKKYPIQYFNPEDGIDMRKLLRDRFKKRLMTFKQCLGEYSMFISKLSHPNIIEYYQMMNQRDKVTEDIRYICILMKYCNRGSLKKFLEDSPNLTELEVEIYFKQILSAFKYLQSQNPKITHGDLKPENIFVQEKKGKIFLKLADFGNSQKIFKLESPLFRDPIRSLPYCAPQFLDSIKIIIKEDGKSTSETYTKEFYSDKCDIWSLGVVLFYMIFQRSPWGDDCDPDHNEYQVLNALKMRFAANNKPEIIYPRPIINAKLSYAIREMLVVNEINRISWEELYDLFDIKQKKKCVISSMNAIKQEIQGNSIHLDPMSEDNYKEKRKCSIYDLFTSNEKEGFSEIIKKNENPMPEMVEESKSSLNTLRNITDNSKISNLGSEFDSNIKDKEDELDISRESLVFLDIKYKSEILKCCKFNAFILALTNRIQKHYYADSKILIFFLLKWQYAIYLPLIRDILKENQGNPKIRAIKWKILQYLSKNRGFMVSEEIFQSLIPSNDLVLELMSDTIPETRVFYELMGNLIFKIMNMIKIDINNGGNLIQEQEINLMKEKLFIYQDLCVVLYADEFFNLERDFNNPFDLKKLDKKRAKIKYEKLRKELKL